MPREQYQDRLAGLRADILSMGELVADRLRMALDALDRRDETMAREVIEGDAEINKRYLDLESACIDLLALQQPVASDLRFVTASFKILTDIERIADLAGNLAGYALDVEYSVFPDVDIQQIGAAVLSVVDTAMEAYEDGDPERCRAVARRDDEIDQLCETASDAVVKDLITSVELPATEIEAQLPEVRRLLLTVRDLERIGDHAENVAARTLYMVENDDELLE